jgi:tetratricopeptide (TPR) repeat protein
MLKQWQKKYEKEDNGVKLYALAQDMLRNGHYQNAAYALHRVNKLMPVNVDAWLQKAFCEYMCGNYSLCLHDNEEALRINPEAAYALKGKGIALYKLGRGEEGLQHLKRAAEITGYEDDDILNDLRVINKMIS